ncbi:hypothetical protein HYW43_00990 [Candidatus Daviesbacteria bacterium]|nr:hypothetical protein [Candidatus Daviesbacteria bacterium]
MFIKLATFLICLLLFLLPKDGIANETNKFITIVNPIRISKYTQNIQNSFQAQYQEVQKRNLSATWLLDFNALDTPALISDLNKIDKLQELGIFLEITPQLADASKVLYNKTDSWHRAHALFLSGYPQTERIKLIDTVFGKFKQTFGFYPKSVGAWWIDSFSLEYMQKKYNITTNLGLADQFSTDGYQVWGQFWSTPFIPAKFHAGIPANSLENSLKLVTIEWASRDPLNGYGSNPANNYSTQDYFTINLNDDYFSKLLDLYLKEDTGQLAQITIGLEGDLDPSAYQGIFARQLDIAKTKKAKFQTMSEFADWYLRRYQVTPVQSIIANDILESGKKVIWYQSPNYRIGMSINAQTNESEIFDFRVYPQDFTEPNYISPNKQLNLFINLPSVIDKASYPKNSWIVSKKRVTNILRQGDSLVIEFDNENIRFNKENIALQNINSLPIFLKTTPLLKVDADKSSLTVIPQTKYIIPKEGLIFNGLSINAAYFMKRPKVQAAIYILTSLILLGLFFLLKSKLSGKTKLIISAAAFSLITISGSAAYFLNSQTYEVSQSEADALLNLSVLPYGSIAVLDDGCLICTYHTKYPPPFFANNRNYISSITKKPVIYNNKIFNAKTRPEGRKELKRIRAKYIYVTKFEDYQEVLPFSPGDYFIDLIYENANAQIWKLRDNAPL